MTPAILGVLRLEPDGSANVLQRLRISFEAVLRNPEIVESHGMARAKVQGIGVRSDGPLVVPEFLVAAPLVAEFANALQHIVLEHPGWQWNLDRLSGTTHDKLPGGLSPVPGTVLGDHLDGGPGNPVLGKNQRRVSTPGERAIGEFDPGGRNIGAIEHAHRG